MIGRLVVGDSHLESMVNVNSTVRAGQVQHADEVRADSRDGLRNIIQSANYDSYSPK